MLYLRPRRPCAQGIGRTAGSPVRSLNALTRPAVTYATPCPVAEYFAPVPAVYAATAPVAEYVAGLVSSQNAMPFTRTWVSPRNSASISQRFGSMKRQKFDQCGRQYEKHADGEITISMKAYIQNLRKASLTLERAKQLDDELSLTECHEFRDINGCLQWITKELLYPFQFVVKVLQRRQGQPRVRDLLKANEVIDEIKQHEDFALTLEFLI